MVTMIEKRMPIEKQDYKNLKELLNIIFEELSGVINAKIFASQTLIDQKNFLNILAKTLTLNKEIRDAHRLEMETDPKLEFEFTKLYDTGDALLQEYSGDPNSLPLNQLYNYNSGKLRDALISFRIQLNEALTNVQPLIRNQLHVTYGIYPDFWAYEDIFQEILENIETTIYSFLIKEPKTEITTHIYSQIEWAFKQSFAKYKNIVKISRTNYKFFNIFRDILEEYSRENKVISEHTAEVVDKLIKAGIADPKSDRNYGLTFRKALKEFYRIEIIVKSTDLNAPIKIKFGEGDDNTGDAYSISNLELVENLPSNDLLVEELVEENDLIRWFDKILEDRVEDATLNIYFMLFKQGYTAAEAARELGVTPAIVGSQVRKIKQILERNLGFTRRIDADNEA